MSQSSGLLTTAGHALIAAQIAAAENLVITTFKFANVVGLDPEELPENYAQTEPTDDIVHTMNVTRAGSINSDTVVYSAVLDSTVGDFEFNWIGLYDESGILVMIKYTYPQQKTGNAFGGGNNLTRNFSLKFVGAADVTSITIPAESWQFDVSAYVFERLEWTEISVDTLAEEAKNYRLMAPLILTVREGDERSIQVVADVDSGIALLSPATIKADSGKVRTRRGAYDEFLITKTENTWRVDFVSGVPTL